MKNALEYINAASNSGRLFCKWEVGNFKHAARFANSVRSFLLISTAQVPVGSVSCVNNNGVI